MIEKSQSIVEIAKALAKFQGKVQTVKKEQNVKVQTTTGGSFNYKYADLSTILEEIRQPLAESQLSISQFPVGEDELVTILMHESGEYLQGAFKMKPSNTNPQGQGSRITYMRRYALSAVLGIVTEDDDDDGNTATNQKIIERHPSTKIEKKEPKAPAKIPATKIEKPPREIIMAYLVKLGAKQRLDKEEYEAMVKSMTSLELKEENYDEIIGRLAVRLQESKQNQ